MPWMTAGLAIAASVLLIWRVTGTDGLPEASERPLTTQQEVAEASVSDAPMDSADPIAHVLDGGVDGPSLRLLAGLELRYDGSGMLGGSTRAPVIRWDRGRIDLEVDPAAGLSVSVETSEARVRVLGTVFAVERSPLGTNISVSRGRVQVDCESGSSHTLVGGAMALCLPTTAAGMLGRSRALSSDPEEALRALDLGLTLEPSDAIAGELHALRLDTLLTLDRLSEALEAAHAYVDVGGPREGEVLMLAASIALGDGNCEQALPFLERLAPTSRDAAWHYEECTEKIRTETPR